MKKHDLTDAVEVADFVALVQRARHINDRVSRIEFTGPGSFQTVTEAQATDAALMLLSLVRLAACGVELSSVIASIGISWSLITGALKAEAEGGPGDVLRELQNQVNIASHLQWPTSNVKH